MSDIHVISTSYNSNKYAVNNIVSVYSQKLKPKSHIYIDDMSSDNTVKILNEFKISNLFNAICKSYKLSIQINNNKKFKLLNLCESLENTMYKDDDVVCILDGDDWLSNDNVLNEVNHLYMTHDLDYLYTNWMYSHNNELGISKKIPDNSWNPYSMPWITSALSTFKVGCFRAVNKENFLDENKEYFKMGCDQAYVLPILEKSRRDNDNYSKVMFLNKPHYIYQFIENKNKPRRGILGIEMAQEAHTASSFIRKRGYIE